MAEQSTITVYALNGTNQKFTIPFEYLARRFVTVTLLGTSRTELEITSGFRFLSTNQIETTQAWGSAQGYTNIEIRRNTSATQRLVDFYDGSVLRSRDLNVSAIQTIHIAEEARNLAAYTLAADDDGNLDARGRRLVNLGDAVNPKDALTLGQVMGWSQSALNQANRSQAEADKSAASAQAAAHSASQSDVVSLRQELANPDMGAAMMARGVVAVESIADLLALSEGQRKEGLRYLVKGYYSGSDVGGGEFYYNPDLADIDDGGLVLKGFVRTPRGPITPYMFGTFGDGVSDDTVALQKWIVANHGTKECVGSFKTTDFLDLPSGFHAVFDAQFLPEIDHGLGDYYSQFNGVFSAKGAVTGVSSLLAADVTIGTTTIQVSDASSFSAGDHIVITQDEHPNPTGYDDYRDHWVDTFCKVLSVEGNSLELSTYMAHPFKLSLQAKVEKVIPVTDVHLLGSITFDMTRQPDRVCSTYFECASEVRLGNLSILAGGGGRGFQFTRCFDVRCGVLSRANSAIEGAGHSYTTSFLSSNDCRLEEARGFRITGRVFDASTGTFNVKVGKVLCVNSRNAAGGHGMNTCGIEVVNVVQVDSAGTAVIMGNSSFYGDHDWTVGTVVVRGGRSTTDGAVFTGNSRNLRVGSVDVQDCTGYGKINHGAGSKGLYIGSVFARNIVGSVVGADGMGAEDFHIGRLVVEGSCSSVVSISSRYGRGVVIDWMDTRRAAPTGRVISISASPEGEPRKVVDLHLRGGHIGSLNNSSPTLTQEGTEDTARTGIYISDCVFHGRTVTLRASESLFLRGNTFIDSRPIIQHISKNFIYTGNLSQGSPDIPADNGVDIVVSGNGRYI